MPLMPIRIFRVAERSMEPSIKEGSYVIAYCWRPKLNSGDAIVFRSPNGGMVLVKRIKSISGGRIFAVGDNLKESTDSREFGDFGVDQVMGKVIFVV